MLERLVPAGVSVCSSRGDVADVFLFEEEEEAIAAAVEKRRREFATARDCARRALARLGVAPAPIIPGPGGAPAWPAGIVGSITHCDGYRGCAVARADELLTIGVDAEPNEPLPEGLLADIALGPELTWIRALAQEAPDVHWDRLLFSAKEAVYKAWYPLTARWLGFEDAVVSVGGDGSFSARLLVRGPAIAGREITHFSGRWEVCDGIVLAAVAKRAGPTVFD